MQENPQENGNPPNTTTVSSDSVSKPGPTSGVDDSVFKPALSTGSGNFAPKHGPSGQDVGTKQAKKILSVTSNSTDQKKKLIPQGTKPPNNQFLT